MALGSSHLIPAIVVTCALLALDASPPRADLLIEIIAVQQSAPKQGEADPIQKDSDSTPQQTESQRPSIPAQPPETIIPPEDSCLPPLYRNWQELGQESMESQGKDRFSRLRILIDRSNFLLSVEGIKPDGSSHEIYRTHVALGGTEAPTPDGKFIINHVYCYPDVLYFASDQTRITNLYKGFFAPLLLCQESGRCQRFRDLGIHGYDSSAYPGVQRTDERNYGPLSSGCIRVPDPCKLKTLLISLVGVGPLKKNDRGCYHWLKSPVEVLIEGDYPWMNDDTTIASIVHGGLRHVQEGIMSVLGILGQ